MGHRAVFPLLLCLSTAVAPPVTGQISPEPDQPASARLTGDNPSSFAFGIGYGSVRSEYLKGFYLSIGPGGELITENLGGFTLNLRLLLRTGLMDGRLRVGGEFGIVTIKSGEIFGGSECIPPGSTCASPDDAAYHVNGVAALRLVQGAKFAVNIEGGGGVVFFVIRGAGGFQPTPGPAPFGSVRLLGSIRLNKSTSLDPFLGALRALGDTHATALNAGLGLSFHWGLRD